MIERLVIIGVGLIGGSLSLALKKAGVVKHVVGYGRNESQLKKGIELAVIDSYQTSLDSAIESADMIVSAVPLGAMQSVFHGIGQCLRNDAVITDVGSAKGSVVAVARKALGDRFSQFVPGHPVAGTENSGVEAGCSTLYQNRRVILTPLVDTNKEAVRAVDNMWQQCGASVEYLSVDHHDKVLAATSHLPHMLAYAMVNYLSGLNEHDEIFKYAAGGFRDFTRIASSDPVMWRDVCLSNGDALLEFIEGYKAELDMISTAIKTNDAGELLKLFGKAKSERDLLIWQFLMTVFKCLPGGSLTGSVRVPGDKSISHRSIILSSIAEGVSHITGFLQGEDSLNTLKALQAMGVNIKAASEKITVSGVGLHGLSRPKNDLEMGNSGTAMRLLLGLLAGQSFDSTLIGDESLSTRPMNRVINPLKLMGACIASSDNGTAPLSVKGCSALTAINYDLPMASAQVKSCILLAGLYSKGETIIREPAPTRDHSERMLRGFGVSVATHGFDITMRGGQALKATDIDVPSDISSAAFFMVAASIAEGSNFTLRHVGINPTRTGVIDILKLMGANINLSNHSEISGEPVADINIQSANLKGIEIPESLVPLAIDEFPVLFVAAACARGETILTGAKELKVKESDRIQVMADGLVSLGIDAMATPDGIKINGGQLKGGCVESRGDHRIAMAFSMAALRANDAITINHCSNVNTSFPGYVELASKAGLRIESYASE